MAGSLIGNHGCDIGKEIGKGSFHTAEQVGDLGPFQVLVIPLAAFIVVTNQAGAVDSAEVKPLFELVPATDCRLAEVPDHHLPDVTLPRLLFLEKRTQPSWPILMV